MICVAPAARAAVVHVDNNNPKQNDMQKATCVFQGLQNCI